MDNSGKRQLKNTCIQEEAPMDMTPRIHYEVSCHNQWKKSSYEGGWVNLLFKDASFNAIFYLFNFTFPSH